MSLGNFEDAIAYAPKVSMNYWKSCVERYQEKLELDVRGTSRTTSSNDVEDPLDELVSYQLLMGEYKEAFETLEHAGQNSGALLVKAVEMGGGYPSQKVVSRHEANRSVVKTEQLKTFQDLGPLDKDLVKFTNTQAQRRFEQRQPLLSAAIHLSLNDVRRAI
jgi:hypothetical protein